MKISSYLSRARTTPCPVPTEIISGSETIDGEFIGASETGFVPKHLQEEFRAYLSLKIGKNQSQHATSRGLVYTLPIGEDPFDIYALEFS